MNLDNIKCVVFDFDNTIAIHVKERRSNPLNLPYWYDEMNQLFTYTSPWKESRVLDYMQDFIDELNAKGVVLAICSATEIAPLANAKVEWARKQCGVDFMNLCCGTPESKVTMLDVLSHGFKYKHNEVLIVDDRAGTLEDAVKNGYQVANPSDIYLYMQDTGRLCSANS